MRSASRLSVVIHGMDNREYLEESLAVVKNFKRLTQRRSSLYMKRRNPPRGPGSSSCSKLRSTSTPPPRIPRGWVKSAYAPWPARYRLRESTIN